MKNIDFRQKVNFWPCFEALLFLSVGISFFLRKGASAAAATAAAAAPVKGIFCDVWRVCYS